MPGVYLWIRTLRHQFLSNRAPVLEWQTSAVEFYSSFLSPGDLCFDIGANRGDRTEILRRTGASVVAVEAQSHLSKVLKKRFAGDRKVQVVHAAVSPEEDTVHLMMAAEADTVATLSSHWTTGRFSGFSWDAMEEVPTVTLDALIQRFGRPCFIKIDVEGYEKYVLETLTQPVSLVSFEFTSEFINDAKVCLTRMNDLSDIEVSFTVGESMEFKSEWTKDVRWLLRRIEKVCQEDSLMWGDIYVRSSAFPP